MADSTMAASNRGSTKGKGAEPMGGAPRLRVWSQTDHRPPASFALPTATVLDAAPKPSPSALPPLHLLPTGSLSSPRIVAAWESTLWLSTTHTFPAAFPRSHPLAVANSAQSTAEPQLPPPGLDAAAAKSLAAQTRKRDFQEWERRCDAAPVESYVPTPREKMGPEKHKAAAQDGPQLWATAQRIVPVPQPGANARASSTTSREGITLVFSHANGFHKEIWEPCLISLLKAAEAQGLQVDEVWSLDAMGSGDSGALNRDKLGETISWFDHPRDLLSLLTNFLPPKRLLSNSGRPSSGRAQIKAQASQLENMGPVWLPPVLQRTAPSEGLHGRRIFGVGHSFSGAALAMLANAAPNLFEGIVIIDGVINNPATFGERLIPHDNILSRGAIARKDVFASRAEAKQYFESKGFFRSWDDRVLDLHVRFGLRPLSIPPPTVEDHQANSGGTSAASAAPANRASQSPEELLKGPCTLSCNKWHEACAFGSSWMSAYAWSALESQRNKGKTHVIVMSETHIYDRERGEIEKLRDLVGEGKGSSEVMEGGHLVAQEQPDLLGEKLADVLARQAGAREAEGQENAARIPQPRL